jgi:hypothetical protein
MDDIAKKYLLRYDKAKAIRSNFEPLYNDCYEYALPQRGSFYATTPGERLDDKIFDATAVISTQEFASRLQAGIVPNYARWADLLAGSEIPAEERESVNNDLDEVTEYVFEIIHASNFAQEVHESFLDLAVGTAVLAVDEGDAMNPVIFRAVPLPHVVLEEGPNNQIDHIYRERKDVRYSDIPILYPNSTLSKKLKGKDDEDKTTILEVVVRDYSKAPDEAYLFFAIAMDDEETIYSYGMTGVGSNPLICYRWVTAPGEIYGRGPLVQVLSSIKSTNLAVQLILENAQMSISGIYQMEDDGVINTDTIQLVPGTIIPKGVGSAGLQPINAAGRLDFAQIILRDERNAIKEGLYNQMLGDPNKTPATATEIAERMADLSKRIGAAFGRLQSELVNPVLQRVIYILKKQGRIEIPTVNGREVKVRSVSPLAQAQNNEDIASVARYLQLVGSTFGPEMLNLLIDTEATSVHLAKKFGVPDSLVRDAEQREEIARAVAQMQQQQQQQQQAAPEEQVVS